MVVLITSILCQSGLMTHVHDLIDYLQSQGLAVAIAYKKVNFMEPEAAEKQLKSLKDIPYCIYDSSDQLKKFAQAQAVDLIHAHSYATFDAVSDISVSLDIPLVITLHSVYPWQLFFQDTLKQAEQIIAVGFAQARSAFLYQEKIEIIENGIDTEKFHPEDLENGTINKTKNINVLWYGRVDGKLTRGIRILDRLAAELPSNIILQALGSTDYQPRNIKYCSWIDNPVQYLQKSQITLGHGRSLREAMACGSVGLLLGYGYGGLITENHVAQGLSLDAFSQYNFPRPRVQQILEDIIKLATSDNLVELQKQARDIASKFFTLERMGSRVLAVYKKVIARRS